jgi:hypothetical protein
MSLLDTFFVLFKSDTTDLKKGAEEAERVTKNLDSSLQKVGRDSEQVGASFFAMAKSAKEFLLAAIPAGFATAGIHGAIEFGVELAKTSRVLGTNIEDLNAWRNAVQLAGGNAEQFQGTISSLAEKFNVSSQTILKILPRYADALSRLNPARAQQVGKNLGLDEGTILLLQHSRREVESMIKAQKQLGVVTQQGAEEFLKYDRVTNQVKQSTKSLFTVLALESLPYLIKFYEILQKGILSFIQHKDFVIGGFLGIAAAVAVFGVRMALANLPLYLMSALIVGLIGLFALIYEDVVAFNNGQKSFIGYFINHYPRVAQIVKNAFDVMYNAAWHFLHPLQSIEAALQKIQNLFNQVLGPKAQARLDIFHTNKNVIDQKIAAILKSGVGGGFGSNKSTTSLTTGPITINTQATDAHGIVTSLLGELNTQVAQVINYHADGVSS